MARRELTMARLLEIKRLLGLGLAVNEIKRTLHCSKETIRKIRDGKKEECDIGVRAQIEPIWVAKVNFEEIIKDVKAGHTLKHIWEESVSEFVGYSGFWKQFSKLHPEIKNESVTLREFAPGSQCEVDYAGDTVEYHVKNGETKKAVIFVGILCHSQLMFAKATVNSTSRYFLDSHASMYEYFKGVPEVTTCDCLKQGVLKCHRYDPEINVAYADMAKHYRTAIVPARVRHPKDKALVEGAVKIIMRYFKFINRHKIFYSIAEINLALQKCIEELNNKKHSRLNVSRRELFELNELSKLKPLPQEAYETYEYKECKVHSDSHIHIWQNYYSVPHIYRGKTVKVKVGKNIMEIFYELDKVATHIRATHVGQIITEINHLPENSRAYKEITPQNLLSQAKFINKNLHQLIEQKFQEDVLGNIRRVQGIINYARKEVQAIGHERASINITRTCSDILNWNKFRSAYFKERLQQYRKIKSENVDEIIVRDLSNPMIRYNKFEGEKT